MSSLEGQSISRTYQRLLQTDSEITDGSLKQVSTGKGTSTSMKLSTDKVEFSKVGIGTSGTTPDGLLHVLSVSAGSVTASSFANQLTLENSGDSGLSILSGVSSFGNIYFGDANDNDAGRVSYNHSNDSMSFYTSGSESMIIDNLGNLTIGGTLNQSLDRYTLTETFLDLPYKDVVATEVSQSTDATTAVTSNTRTTRITTQSVDLAASDSVEFIFNNTMIQDNSHVLAYVINSSGTIADNAMINVMVHDVDDTSCKIRIATNAVDVAAQTYEIEVMVDPHLKSNSHWELVGTNSSELFSTYGGSVPGLQLQTLSGDNDQMIIIPKSGNSGIYAGGPHAASANVSAWGDNQFRSQFETDLSVAISTPSNISDVAIFAGMKLTATGAYATDVDQAYFLYSSNDDLGALTTNGNLHFIYSVAGTDYITDLGITVATSTVYRLRLVFDESRKLSVFVNGVQYGLTHTPTSTTAGGVTESNATQKSLANTSGAAIIPVIGVQTLTTATKQLYVHFAQISRSLA
jgi:hypothetical protein